MNRENMRRTNAWKVTEQYVFDYEMQRMKRLNRKRSCRYGYAERDERIHKYGLSNYLAYSEELIA